MSARLTWSYDHLGYYIYWNLDGNDGARLGECRYTIDDLQRTEDPEEREHIAATLAAANSDDVKIRSEGYYWGTKRKAQAALKLAREAAKRARAGTPWPEWALKAKAAGWTPPKGWTP